MTIRPEQLGNLTLKELLELRTRAIDEIEQRQLRCAHAKVEFTLLQHCLVDIIVEEGVSWVSNDDHDHEIQDTFSVVCFHCAFTGHYTHLDQAPEWVKQRYEVARAAH